MLEHNPPQATASMILMHGLGASGDDLFPLAAMFGGDWLRVVCPNAAARPVTVNGGMSMRAWYDITGADLQDRQDTAGVADSTALIEELIAAEKSRGIAAQRIFLAGFSQGAAMALQVGLRHTEQLAGIVALSGYLLFAQETGGYAAANRQTPIFQAHGMFDPVVLLKWAHASRDVLKQEGYSLTYKEYPTTHAIAPDEITDLARWLTEIEG